MVKRSNSISKPSKLASNHPYKGVRMRTWGSWVSEIRVPHQKTRIWLGSYSTPEAAARAYDAALLCLKGSSAGLNFPDSLSHHENPTIVTSTKLIQKAAAAAANNTASPTNPTCSRSLPPPTSPLLSEVTESDSYVSPSLSLATACSTEGEQWLDFADLDSPKIKDLLLGQCGLFNPLEDQCEDEGDMMSLWSFC